MNKTTPRQRNTYDWDSLKEQFLASDIDTPFTFLKQTLNKYKTSSESIYSKNTKGWKEEKAELRKARTEKIKENVANAHGWNADKLLKLKWDIINVVNNKLDKEKDDLKANDLKVLWEMIKTEVGEASSIEEMRGQEEKKPFSWYGE